MVNGSTLLYVTHHLQVKFSMLKSGIEEAYVVFDGTNTDQFSWFSDLNILYSSYGSSLDNAALDICSIEGLVQVAILKIIMSILKIILFMCQALIFKQI